MMKRQSIRLLITLVLAAGITAALASEAFAADRYASVTSHATTVSKALKPGVRPMSGEPDTGGSAAPPKDGTYPTGGVQLSVWQTLQWSVRTWLRISPVRFPY
jgi:hypothetical protein